MQGKEGKRKQEEVNLYEYDIPFVVLIFLCEEYVSVSLSDFGGSNNRGHAWE